MSIVKTLYLQCDECDELSTDSTSPTYTTIKKLEMALIRPNGWMKKGNKHYCEDCKSKIKR